MAERRLATARANAVEQGKNMANKMGEAATMEAQIAVQPDSSSPLFLECKYFKHKELPCQSK